MELSGDAVKLRFISPAVGTLLTLKVAKLWIDEVIKTRPMNTGPDGIFSRDLPIKKQLRIRWQDASYDPLENPYGAPLTICGGNIVAVVVYFAGVPGAFGEIPVGNPLRYYAPAFLIDQTAHEFDASSPEGLQPWSAGGLSQGPYYLPSQSFG
jgi:hypothetical protein